MTERDQTRQARREAFLPMIQSQSEASDDDQVPSTGLLVDRYGRRIRNLRISVTDKCNFRCTYCMPAEGLPWLQKAEILSYEEITRMARIAVGLGIEQIRLTGGEPLVRRDLPELVRQLRQIEGLQSLSLTTNGILLKQQARALASAGLTRINVSLDSLMREKFAQVTRRDQMDRVLEGLEEVARYPSIRPIKINAVAIRGFSEEEVLALVQFARSKAYRMRWIEFMPLDADQHWRKEEILTGGEIKTIIEAVYGPLVPVPGDPAETARHAATPSPTASVRSASLIQSVNPSAPPVIAFA